MSDNDSNEWVTESESEAESEKLHFTAPPLLPIPVSIARPNDRLCDTCAELELTPQRFVVLPDNSDAKFDDDDDDDEDEDGDEGDDGDDNDDIESNNEIQLGLVEDVKKRSESCPLCRLVLKALSNGDVPDVEDGQAVSISLSWQTDGPEDHPQIRVLCPYARKENDEFIDVKGQNLFPEITLLANDAPTPSKSYFGRLIPDQIDFNMLRNWLAMCNAEHGDLCNQSKMLDHEIKDPAAEIPFFRLIDVVDNCIVVAPHNSRYVALSYVWGNIDASAILRLLKTNAQDLEKPGSLLEKEYHDKIPITIRDAMLAVRELHIRYLWTDSLCIIQDDNDEHGSKFDAISKMDLVYGAAYSTIIAASGIDANSGLPGVRPGTRDIIQPVEEIAPNFRLVFKTRSEDYIKSSMYYKRGWTFQEQSFATRTLTFVGGQVEYRCRKDDVGWREDCFTESQSKVKATDKHKKPNDIGDFEAFISTYTGLSLTFRSDIYNAFAGVSRYFKTGLQANLCHGIPDKFFDWFLTWTPLYSHTRRNDAPSWSWSGWNGECGSDIWDWYERNLTRARRAQHKRTWIIWYQRKAHDSEECIRIWTSKEDPTSPRGSEKRGGRVKDRFPFNCTQTTPTPRTLTGAPTYIEDAYHPTPGSGFLQFWTVSALFRLAEPTSRHEGQMPLNKYTRLGIFGGKGTEVGTIFIDPTWCKDNVTKTHEFIIVCEQRDKRVEDGHSPDEEPGWMYMAMLIEWHGDWAERVAVGLIKKRDLKQALGGGPVWKEIILG
ncbi:HET-domain-containing protein [Pholiota conissans]|uniref:HET-domain-containing protein n=1 Tax=Pholiota conissans TaxID=109636 RepID=A0A9P5Z3D4_9AGAR|nr:HET-domain-containing protein [Pholiota conissans]